MDLQAAGRRPLKLASDDPLHLSSADHWTRSSGTLNFARDVIGSLGASTGPITSSAVDDEDTDDSTQWTDGGHGTVVPTGRSDCSREDLELGKVGEVAPEGRERNPSVSTDASDRI